MCDGWAVRSLAGAIYIKTVSDTRRAAIVNWLVAERGVPVFATTSDEQIEDAWKHFGKHVDCIQVAVTSRVTSDSSTGEA